MVAAGTRRVSCPRLKEGPSAPSERLPGFRPMDRHRLPGMSVSSEEWTVLAARAEAGNHSYRADPTVDLAHSPGRRQRARNRHRRPAGRARGVAPPIGARQNGARHSRRDRSRHRHSPAAARTRSGGTRSRCDQDGRSPVVGPRPARRRIADRRELGEEGDLLICPEKVKGLRLASEALLRWSTYRTTSRICGSRYLGGGLRRNHCRLGSSRVWSGCGHSADAVSFDLSRPCTRGCWRCGAAQRLSVLAGVVGSQSAVFEPQRGVAAVVQAAVEPASGPVVGQAGPAALRALRPRCRGRRGAAPHDRQRVVGLRPGLR